MHRQMSHVKSKKVRFFYIIAITGFKADFPDLKPASPELVSEFNDYLAYYFKDSINAPDIEMITTAKDSLVELISKVNDAKNIIIPLYS
jgi:hypothetical protein